MRSLIVRLLYLAIATQFVFACSLLRPVIPSGELTGMQSRHVARAEQALQQLKQVDALVKLDNHNLSKEISDRLKAQAKVSGRYRFHRLELSFGKQTIGLKAKLEIQDGSGNVISATIIGEVLLDFTGDQLEWFPFFSQLLISSENFTFGGDSYASPLDALQTQILKRLKTDIAGPLALQDRNVIPLVVPLGNVDVGVALPGLGNLEARQSKPLGGVFIVADSSMLIDSQATTIALDLEFIPNLSICPADVTVTRSGFAIDVKGREPVDLAGFISKAEDVQYFYSEISGARRPLTIIHYWFEDGQPLAVQNLPVGPSERWRTWSSRANGRSSASKWEVLVVEKESGCILRAQSVRTQAAFGLAGGSSPASETRRFNAFRDAYKVRVKNFSTAHEKPKIAQVEVMREFLEQVLQNALADLQLEASFKTTKLPELENSAYLWPFATSGIICEPSTCPRPPVCAISVSQCKRLRDTRDCSSCLFRNPLNNRCVSQTTDPFCEAARNRQNEKYETDRRHCIARAQAAKQDCEALWTQLTHSCELESGFEQSSCEAVKTEIESLPDNKPIATVDATARLSGQLTAVFSNFSVEKNFSRLKYDLILKTGLALDGQLKFHPERLPQNLNTCISTWQAPFSARVISPARANSMLATLKVGNRSFTSNWSGYILPFVISPTPLQSVFRNNPHLLADCSIHLTSKEVTDAIQGAGATFYDGQLVLEIQPLATRIDLLPAHIRFSTQTRQGDAVISANYVKYKIKDIVKSDRLPERNP